MVNMSPANDSCIHLPLALFFVSSVSCFLIALRRSVVVVLAIWATPLSALKVINLVSFISVQWSRLLSTRVRVDTELAHQYLADTDTGSRS